VLLLVHVDHLSGVGGFGFEGGEASRGGEVRRVVMPHREDSVFSWVLANGRTYQGPLKATVHNTHFIEQLGGSFPDEVIAVPMLVSGVVAAILYGDNAPSGRPIGRIDWLEAVIDHTARIVEAEGM